MAEHGQVQNGKECSPPDPQAANGSKPNHALLEKPLPELPPADSSPPTPTVSKDAASLLPAAPVSDGRSVGPIDAASPLLPPIREASDYLVAGALMHDESSPAPVQPNGGHAAAQPAAAVAGASSSGAPDVSPDAEGKDRTEAGADPAATSTPGRRSVQFARENVVLDAAAPPFAAGAHSRHGSWDGGAESGSPGGSPRQPPKASFISKLKALATTTGLQTPKSPLSGLAPSQQQPPMTELVSPTTVVPAGSSPTTATPGPSQPQQAQGQGPQSSLGQGRLATAARGVPQTLNEEREEDGSDVDADAEETADETAAAASAAKAKKRKRRMRRRRLLPQSEPGDTAPNTPARISSRLMGDADSPLGGAFSGASSRLNIMRRRTMPDAHAAADDRAGGVSEGEGLARESYWRRGNTWMTGSGALVPRGHGGDDVDEHHGGADSPYGRRMGHLRRISVFGGGVSDGDAMTPRRPLFTGERATTFGAQKWKQVKGAFRMLRAAKKDETFDYLKSAELMAELRAGAPAVLMLASMIQRDEHGNKRIPVLLEQLKLRIVDSAPSELDRDDSARHWVFTIELEYGSGPSKMKWTVKRTIYEIWTLHLRYRLALRSEKYLHGHDTTGTIRTRRPKQPKFPLSAFPYLRSARELDDEDDLASIRGADDTAEGTGGEATASEAERTTRRQPTTPKKKTSLMGSVGAGLFSGSRRRSTGLTDVTTPGSITEGGGGFASGGPVAEAAATIQKRRFIERQRLVLEKYLQEMIRWLMFRADSNRLCRFLELSALGVRLAAEGSYHGKECYLYIRSSKGLDFRRVLTPSKVIARHSRKWFLVRQSYVVCVESPENMNVYDVYLVDSRFKVLSKSSKLKQIGSKATKGRRKDGHGQHRDAVDLAADQPRNKHHTLTLVTSERKVKLFSRNQNIIRQFEESISEMLRETPWFLPNRFESFAPVRRGVHAQWLVDGRDYMWNVSRAINMARDVIYIHGWWLSPELYMRRPACISQKWRLDRLLQRKAREGVKIFVIIYRNVEAAIPIDSEYTKFSLLNLHPNVFVQRSPNQFKKNQFFFAHHEKIVIVDHDVAFLGGIDLCFGRWDSPQHNVDDAKPTGFEQADVPKDADNCQMFPGKDYSNPRVQDFQRLNLPYEEMYDRRKTPRMPWHDVGMQVVGQPARDLTRHFVQRWNYLRRGRKPTRPTPFLLPPPDIRPDELEALGLSGTCEVQILRSTSTWSLGIEHTEQSIHVAYIKMIEESEHFIYMENQFFITSTETMNTRMTNRIGDALVDRIIRAHENEEDWRCVVVLPLMPGFQNTVDQQEGTSVRLILQCQFRSICRGENSIFGRLRAVGIDPEDYIQFFSLRQWGKIGVGGYGGQPAGPGLLVTEQLYVHAKIIIVDDRVALIGSANINERSMLGNRDSEAAAIVRDTDLIWSTMAGRPYQVGRFAFGLRMRLMREHLGLPVDEILEAERQAQLEREAEAEAEYQSDMDDEAYDTEPVEPSESSSWDGRHRRRTRRQQMPKLVRGPSINHDVDLDEEFGSELERLSIKTASSKGKERAKSFSAASRQPDPRVVGNIGHEREVAGFGPDHWADAQRAGVDQGRDSVIVNGNREVLVHSFTSDHRGTLDKPAPPLPPPQHHRSPLVSPPGPHPSSSHSATDNVSVADDALASQAATLPPVPPLDRRTTEQLGLPRSSQLPSLPQLDDTDIGGPPMPPQVPPALPPGSLAGTTVAGGPVRSELLERLTSDIRLANIDRDCMRDPLNPAFYDDVWNRVAENNTKIYRRVFRCMPDNEVVTWHDYRQYDDYYRRFMESMEAAAQQPPPPAPDAVRTTGGDTGGTKDKESTVAPGIAAPGGLPVPAASAAKEAHSISEKTHGDFTNGSGGHGNGVAPRVVVSGDGSEQLDEKSAAVAAASSGVGNGPANEPEAYPSQTVMPPSPESPGLPAGDVPFPAFDSAAGVRRGLDPSSAQTSNLSEQTRRTTPTDTATSVQNGRQLAPGTTAPAAGGSVRRRRRTTTKGGRARSGIGPLGYPGENDLVPRAEAEAMLSLVQGNLVQFPYDWLLTEENNGNWLYQVDQVAPLQIYN